MISRILLVRNDKLGDFMLAWPTFALIKYYWPQVQLSVLIPRYTSPIAEICPWIDNIIIDEQETARALAVKLCKHNFDAMITLFSTGRVGLAGWLAKIPYRLAPATKAAQLFYNHRLLQRRSQSTKPEYAYNLDLAYQFLLDMKLISKVMHTNEVNNDWLPREIPRPLLRLDQGALKQTFCKIHNLPADSRLVFIHPGSGGSANNLTPTQYAELANKLAAEKNAFVISAGPGEQAVAEDVASRLTSPHAIHHSSEGLAGFARTLQLADLFISGSTGPMHLAAALDRPTATFFPRHRSATPLRWQPLNHPNRRLVFVPPDSASADDVSAIDIEAAASQITAFLSDGNSAAG